MALSNYLKLFMHKNPFQQKHLQSALNVLFLLFLSISFNTCTMQNKNGGIIFLRTAQLEEITDFYIDSVGCTLWLDQGGCRIFQHGNMLLGFCGSEQAETEGVITFFYPYKEGVDAAYKIFKDKADDPPRENSKYRIYHFYTRDPEGRSVEFQAFLHELDPY